MNPRLFDSSIYALSSLAIQTLVTSVVVMCLGLFAMIRERGSQVSVVFFIVTLSVGVWLFSFSWMYSTPDLEAAFWWAKIGHIGIALIPAACYHFCTLMQENPRQFQWKVMIVWTLSILFASVMLSTDIVFNSFNRFHWGLYPRYHAASIPFVVFFLFITINVISSFWLGYRHAGKGSMHMVRLRTLMIAFSIGYVAELDFVGAFGIPFYPFGYVPIIFFISLSTFTVVRYRFVDITPAFAAPQIIETMSEALLVLDKEGVIRLVNRAACSLFGHSEQELLGRRADKNTIDVLSFLDEFDSLVKRGTVRDYEVTLRRKDAIRRTLSMSTSVMLDRSDKPLAVVCVARDVTDQKRAEEEVLIERDNAQKYLDVAGVVLAVIDAGQNVVRINLKGCKILGYREEEIIGKNWFDNFTPERNRQEAKETYQMQMTGKSDLVEHYESPVICKSGEERIIAWHSTLLKDDAGAFIGTLSSGEDITERKSVEKQIYLLAYYDSLTRLPNRIFFKELLNRALVQAQRYNRIMAVLFIDLDFFKRINDMLGHSIGDRLLQAAAGVITQCVRRSDFVARSDKEEQANIVSRLGGDEFIVLLNEIAHSHDASKVAQRILNELSRPFTIGEHEVFISASAGIALYPTDGKDAEVLLKNADIAMYSAKTQGRNNFQFFDASMNATALSRLNLESELRKAMERNEFSLYYQPILDLRRKTIVGAEALIRWIRPEQGIVSPAEFIPLAEETGLIVPIGEWVLRTACLENVRWRSAGIKPLRIAINLSSRQFDQQNLADIITTVIKESGIDPQYLEVEITESAIMRNPEKAAKTLRQLKAMGVHVSIDDFGTGFSSLAHLKRFPLDTLKIDRSLIMNVTSNSDDAAIAGAIIAMAHTLRLRVIAEGVETEQQHAFLCDLGCDEAQGFLFSRPQPSEKFISLLKEKSDS